MSASEAARLWGVCMTNQTAARCCPWIAVLRTEAWLEPAQILRHTSGGPHPFDGRYTIMPKAIRFDHAGGPEVLRIEDLPERQPALSNGHTFSNTVLPTVGKTYPSDERT
jgi:hypothetical protein